MIALAPAAERQLEAHYAERGRDAAIDRLVDSLEHASERYLAGRGLFYDPPRPYPTMLRPGWRWTKEGRYWIAFSQDQQGVVIRALFYGAATMPDRL